jgi:hypothetical protein
MRSNAFGSGPVLQRMARLGLFVALAIVAAPGRGQLILQGPDHFPEFRGLSGLAGGGFGTDALGRLSLSGPTAYSTPTAYVLGHDRCFLMIDSIAGHRGFVLGGKGFQTLVGMVGHTVGHLNIAFSDMVLTGQGDQAYNLQIEYVPSPMRLPDGSVRFPHAIFSAGIQDIGGGGGSAGDRLPGDTRSSRTVFGVVTYRMGDAERSPYVSAGVGTRRFMKGFVSASYQVLPPVRLWVEYDGFGTNFGALTTCRLRIARRPVDLQFGLVSVFGRFLATNAGLAF